METVESAMALRYARFVQPIPRLVSLVSHSGFHTVGLNRGPEVCRSASCGKSARYVRCGGRWDGITELPIRARMWKRRIQTRKFLWIYAPALDPTGIEVRSVL
jgi:hypothetical protein